MNDSRTARLAVLIDADNASARIADGLFEEIAKIGEASVRRIYGDFSTQRMKGWTDILARHAIIPHQQFAYTTGKNASDITLVIDAMDLLHSGRFDGFCLVSSDSDFTRLASRIREQGVNVFGFGEQKTPESFRQACRRFIYTENLLPQRVSQSRDSVEPVQAPLREKADALPMLSRVIDQMESEDGWVNLGTFGKQLQALYTDFDPRTYGERKLSDLVRKTNAFEVRHPEGGSLLIRMKLGTKSAAPALATAPTAPARAPAAGLAPSPVAAPMPTAAELAEAAPPAKRARASGRSSTPKAAGTAAAPSSRRAASPRAAAAPKPTVAKPEPVKTETVVAPSSPVAPPAPPKLQQVVSQPAPVVTPAPVPVAAPAPAAEAAAKPAARRIHRPLGTPRS